jgi:hypothetical protein
MARHGRRPRWKSLNTFALEYLCFSNNVGKLMLDELAKVDFGDGQVYLLRIIVNEETETATVFTVYRTSKEAKYWRKS